MDSIYGDYVQMEKTPKKGEHIIINLKLDFWEAI